MKIFLKILAYIIGVVLVGITILLTYVKTMLPSVGDAPAMKVELSNERLERGKYLANHVMVCIDCHSTRDWGLFAGPPMAGTEGKGGEVFDQKIGLPGNYIASNITSSNLGSWTDGEIFRAITTGVSKDGRALFPIMPYHNYGQLDKNDLEAVILYIKSLTPIKNETEKSSSDFPMNFIINTIPKKAECKEIPPVTDVINYGKYLVTAAACMNCHTKEVKGKYIGEPFAGGFEFKLTDGSVVTSANITPDKVSGIGSWTKEKFISRFKVFADSSYKHAEVLQGEFQTVMPWTMYAGMTTEDLTAIYEYLRNLNPVDNTIIKFTPANKIK
ncbi:MAG: c-type cytochrome [Saprospiraceae bacterium]|nr:c-type cytochrome [Saprospiraceae bacterium]